MRHIALAIAFSLWCASCASYTDDTQQMREEYRSGRYADAAKTLDESGIAEQSRNRLLYHYERGMISDRMQERSNSRKLFMEADKISDQLQTVSVSREAATYLYNDSAQEYSGEDYERVAVHSMLALSFLEDQEFKSARIEARKINTKLDEINGSYDADAQNRYKQDAFAQYLSASIYDSLGETDAAIVDYRRSLNVYDDLYEKEFGVSAPDQVIKAFYQALKKRNRNDDIKTLVKKFPNILKDYDDTMQKNKESGEVVMFFEMGTITPKQAFEFFIPFGKQIIRLSFPTIKPRTYADDGGPTVSVKGISAPYQPELLQNMDTIASKTLDDRRMRLVLKTGARLLVKGQLTEQAHKNFGPLGGIAANIYSAVSETADTRGWTLLPGALYASRFHLPAGKHNIVVTYPGRAPKTISIDVRPRSVKLLRVKPA